MPTAACWRRCSIRAIKFGAAVDIVASIGGSLFESFDTLPVAINPTPSTMVDRDLRFMAKFLCVGFHVVTVPCSGIVRIALTTSVHLGIIRKVASLGWRDDFPEGTCPFLKEHVHYGGRQSGDDCFIVLLRPPRSLSGELVIEP